MCDLPCCKLALFMAYFVRKYQNKETENWIKVLLSMALPIRTRTSFLHSQSLPTASFHQPLILIHQRADRMQTTITEN